MSSQAELERAVEEILIDEATLLRRIARAGTPGLPIGPEPSAVLANAVLATADAAATHAGVRLLRWVDDVVLVGTDRSSVVRGFDACHTGSDTVAPAS